MNTPKLLLSVVCALTSVSAFAGSDIVSSNNQISLDSIWTKVDYLESGDGIIIPAGKLDSEKGTVRGYDVTLSVMRKIIWKNDYIRLQDGHSHGNTDYVGSLLSGGSYGSLTGKSPAQLRDVSLRYGTGFTLTDKGMITPYLEYGSHKWDRHPDGGYNENYSDDYYGLGVLGQYSPMHKLVLSADALVGHTKNSYIATGPIYFQYHSVWYVDSLDKDLGNSMLYRYGLSADYAFTKSIHGNIGVDYTEFKYGMSTVDSGGFLEPDSKTKYMTYKIGVGLAF